MTTRTPPAQPEKSLLRALSPGAVNLLASAALNPSGSFWNRPPHATKRALVTRDLYDHGGITPLGEEQVRAYLPDLPARSMTEALNEERKRAEDEASKTSGTRAHIEFSWATRTLVAVDGREVQVKGFVAWRASRLMCPPECPTLTAEWESADDAARAAAEHAREHAAEEARQLWRDPVAYEIARGFLGEPPLPASDLPQTPTVTYVATSVYTSPREDTPVLSRVLLASSTDLSRALNVATGGVGLGLVAVWEVEGEVEPERAQEIARRTRPTYGVTSTRFGLVRVEPDALANLAWGE